MAPYHIRKYQESDRKKVLDLFSNGSGEHIPAAFRHILMLPRSLLLLLGVPLTILLVTGSWFLTILSTFVLLMLPRLLFVYACKSFLTQCLHTDLADITKSYMSARGSCFWVAESEGQVVGIVSALPVEDSPLGKKQLELLRLRVAMEHRGKGIAKALVRTLLHFAWVQGYDEVVLETTVIHHNALALYQNMGFQKTDQYLSGKIWTILGIPTVVLTYYLPSAREDGP